MSTMCVQSRCFTSGFVYYTQAETVSGFVMVSQGEKSGSSSVSGAPCHCPCGGLMREAQPPQFLKGCGIILPSILPVERIVQVRRVAHAGIDPGAVIHCAARVGERLETPPAMRTCPSPSCPHRRTAVLEERQDQVQSLIAASPDSVASKMRSAAPESSANAWSPRTGAASS